MKLILKRLRLSEKQTTGILQVINDYGDCVFTCCTLELPWKENMIKVSSIPPGTYTIVPRFSAKYGSHFWLQLVTGRSMILIHAGNFNHQTMGCILPGAQLKDLNNDGVLDVANSNYCMTILNQFVTGQTTITIS